MLECRPRTAPDPVAVSAPGAACGAGEDDSGRAESRVPAAVDVAEDAAAEGAGVCANPGRAHASRTTNALHASRRTRGTIIHCVRRIVANPAVPPLIARKHKL